MNPIGVDSVLELVLGGHIAAGIVALLSGGVALLTTKGGRRHVRGGQLYVAAMSVVVVSSVPLAVAIQSWFLLAIAVFTAYLVFAGVRAVQRRRGDPSERRIIDVLGHAGMFLAGIAMVLGGIVFSLDLGPVLIVFGAIGTALAGQGLRQPLTAEIVPDHVAYMGGAFIATVTAAVTVNLTMVPPLARWLGPTAIGVPLILFGIRRYGGTFGAARPAGRTAE